VVTGAVPDVGPWLAACDAVAVPLRHGGGTRIKILEALAAGCPVVSTRKGAEGLELEDHRHLRLADGADAMAAALLWCLAEPAAAGAMARRGGERVEKLYSWAANAARVRSAVAALADGDPRARAAAG
jgi:glycosyltransferase involved in cell wall biosynthesis